MARLQPEENGDIPSFLPVEIEKMEKLLKETGKELLDSYRIQRLAKNFNRSSARAGKPSIRCQQIRSWFQSKQQDSQPVDTSPSLTPRETVGPPDAPVANSAPEISSEMPKGEKVPDLSELEFEAKSSKDGAWYDVATFLTHRNLSSGEPEVRVRFVGYGAEEDEWVNVKRGVRERSLPLEASECQKVKAGDLVLCYQERRDQAIYYDGHVIEVQRRLHDIRGCRCLFLVRYDHDKTEERVRLRRLCRRPTY